MFGGMCAYVDEKMIISINEVDNGRVSSDNNKYNQSSCPSPTPSSSKPNHQRNMIMNEMTRNMNDEQYEFSWFWAAAPKGSMTYAFIHTGNFLLLLLLLLLFFSVPPPRIGLEAQIPVSRPKS